MTDELKHRGPAPPDGTMTLEAASRVPGLAGNNHMTIRRAIVTARVGTWLPDGDRRWRVIYAEKKVREIADALIARDSRMPRPPTRPPTRPPRSR